MALEQLAARPQREREKEHATGGSQPFFSRTWAMSLTSNPSAESELSLSTISLS